MYFQKKEPKPLSIMSRKRKPVYSFLGKEIKMEGSFYPLS